MVLPFFSPRSVRFVELRVRKRRRTWRGKDVLRLIQIRLTMPSFEKIAFRLSSRILRMRASHLSALVREVVREIQRIVRMRAPRETHVASVSRHGYCRQLLVTSVVRSRSRRWIGFSEDDGQ